MFRTITAAFRQLSINTLGSNLKNGAAQKIIGLNDFGTLCNGRSGWLNVSKVKPICPDPIQKIEKFAAPALLQNFTPVNVDQQRTVIKFSLKKGKRKTVKTVTERFYRLNWGAWIRPRAGRHKHLWRKAGPLKWRLKQHVFCNATQSRMLDKMVTSFWKKPKYWVDDPYEQYHKREEFFQTRTKPIIRD